MRSVDDNMQVDRRSQDQYQEACNKVIALISFCVL